MGKIYGDWQERKSQGHRLYMGNSDVDPLRFTIKLPMLLPGGMEVIGFPCGPSSGTKSTLSSSTPWLISSMAYTVLTGYKVPWVRTWLTVGAFRFTSSLTRPVLRRLLRYLYACSCRRRDRPVAVGYMATGGPTGRPAGKPTRPHTRAEYLNAFAVGGLTARGNYS